MNNDERIGVIFTKNQLVGINVFSVSNDFLAEVAEVLPNEQYGLVIRKFKDRDYSREYEKLLDISKCIVFKGFDHKNNSVVCDVLSSMEYDDEIKLIIKICSSVNQAQLRRFIRLIVALPVQITGTDMQTDFFGPPIKTQTIDLSAGGLRVICSGNYMVNSEVNIELMYLNGTATAKGVVLRRSPRGGKDFEYALMFKQIDDTNKKLIAQMCEAMSQV